MTGRRLLVAFACAFMLALLLTWFLSKRLARPVLAAAPAPMLRVAAATRPMNVGDTLTPDALTLAAWPQSAAPAGSVQRTQDLAGRVLLVPVVPGQPVLTQFLAAPGTSAGLPAKIPGGMRAVSVHADEISSVAGFVVPDSFVDVLATTHTNGDNNASTVCILADVRVLAVDQKTEPEAAGKPGTAGDTITLLLSSTDAQKLAQASAAGKIQFLLRNGADRANVPVSALPTAVQTAAAARAPMPAPGRSAAAPPHSTAFVVETVSGGRQTSESFEGKNR